MRRICICLMSMLMFLWTCCLAENDMNNIREICAKRSEWKSEYNSNGRRIDVDVPIVIPDVKKIPVISVKPYYAVNGQCLVSRVEPMEKIGEGIQFMRTANFYHIWVKNRRKEEKWKF